MRKKRYFDLFLLAGILFCLISAAPAYADEGTIDISGAVVTADDWVYNGKEASPDVTVTLNGQVLSDWTDYDYDFRPHSAIEVGSVDIVVTGTGDYSGEVHGSFRILPIDLKDVAFVEVYDEGLESTGEALEPSVSVKLDYNTWLSEGEDYTVTYTNNINPGTGTVTIKGIGHYSGTISETFTILYKSYGFYVGDIEVTDGNAADILGDGKVSYDAATRTLSLKNANITGAYSVSLGSGAYAKYAGKSFYSIYTDGALKIKLSGENSLAYSLKGGNITITGQGKLNVPGTTGGNGGECIGVECNSLLISPECSLFVESGKGSYSNLGMKVNDKLDIQGELDVSVLRGAPAKGISVSNLNVSGKLLVTVRSAYTNYAYGISAKKANITGSAAINTTGTKNDTGINCTEMTISNTGSLTVNASTSAVNTNTIQLGNKLVLLAGTSRADAGYHEVSDEALANKYVSISADNKGPGTPQEVEEPGDTKAESKVRKAEAADKNSILNAEKTITSKKDDKDPKGSSFAPLRAKAASITKNTVTVSWSKVKKAKGYIIYANACSKNGKKNKLIRIGTTKKTKYTLKKINNKKLSAGTYYKIVVAAYGFKNGYQTTLAVSKMIHTATSGPKATNVKKITVPKSKVTIVEKKKYTIIAKLKNANSKLTPQKHRKLCYESSNQKIAAVNKGGVVTGKKAGKAVIYVYAQNGVFAELKVTVRKKK